MYFLKFEEIKIRVSLGRVSDTMGEAQWWGFSKKICIIFVGVIFCLEYVLLMGDVLPYSFRSFGRGLSDLFVLINILKGMLFLNNRDGILFWLWAGNLPGGVFILFWIWHVTGAWGGLAWEFFHADLGKGFIMRCMMLCSACEFEHLLFVSIAGKFPTDCTDFTDFSSLLYVWPCGTLKSHG